MHSVFRLGQRCLQNLEITKNQLEQVTQIKWERNKTLLQILCWVRPVWGLWSHCKPGLIQVDWKMYQLKKITNKKQYASQNISTYLSLLFGCRSGQLSQINLRINFLTILSLGHWFTVITLVSAKEKCVTAGRYGFFSRQLRRSQPK